MKIKARLYFLAVFSLILVFTACKKENPIIEGSGLGLKFEPKFSAQAFDFGQLIYTNAAGNLISVTRCEFLISNIKLVKENGGVHTDPTVYYLNVEDSSSLEAPVTLVPFGIYTKLSFDIGLIPDLNVSKTLSTSAEMINMEWPDVMGGGYHFLKLEGRFQGDSITHGYAIHIGTDGFLQSYEFPLNFELSEAKHQMTFDLDLSEYFTAPYTYDLKTDLNYTMGDSLSMSRIVANSANILSYRSFQ